MCCSSDLGAAVDDGAHSSSSHAFWNQFFKYKLNSYRFILLSIGHIFFCEQHVKYLRHILVREFGPVLFS